MSVKNISPNAVKTAAKVSTLDLQKLKHSKTGQSVRLSSRLSSLPEHVIFKDENSQSGTMGYSNSSFLSSTRGSEGTEDGSGDVLMNLDLFPCGQSDQGSSSDQQDIQVNFVLYRKQKLFLETHFIFSHRTRTVLSRQTKKWQPSSSAVCLTMELQKKKETKKMLHMKTCSTV